LGLKGTLSEAEGHVLKQRMYQGKLNKARRGELALPLPMGYVRRSSGEIAFDPDEQVQHVVHLVLRKFEELATLNAVLRYLVTHDIQLGVRVRGGLEWHRPNRMTLQNLLKNPVYAGAYAYGRRQVDPRKKRAGRPSTGRVAMDPHDWVALQRDTIPPTSPGTSTRRTSRGCGRIALRRRRLVRRASERRCWQGWRPVAGVGTA
jgi:hypothetical protein